MEETYSTLYCQETRQRLGQEERKCRDNTRVKTQDRAKENKEKKGRPKDLKKTEKKRQWAQLRRTEDVACMGGGEDVRKMKIIVMYGCEWEHII